ncbi:Cell cycle checkpoint protein rad17 [Toensbergia leucococca]|nr:Cell cycle checkpoint protein rad17 [Toensbergia leucococca]
MPPPPAKRQKRLIVLSSDDEEYTASEKENAKSKLKHLETESKLKLTLPSQSATANTSPEKYPRKSKPTGKQRSSRSVYTFFSAATKQPILKGASKSEVAEVEVEEEEDDFIQDDSLDDELRQLPETLRTAKLVLDRRKGQAVSSRSVSTSAACHKLPPIASQRFMRPGKTYGEGIVTQKDVASGDADLRSWAEKYAPIGLEELAVHKKKVADVRNWLETIFNGQMHKRLLLLKGPSGSGKTATISALAQVMDFSITEWKNPIGSDFLSEGFISMSAQFEDFLGRSGKFGSLSFAENDQLHIQPMLAPEAENTKNKIILLEEFPNTFAQTSSALQSFRLSILRYLSTDTRLPKHPGSPASITPLVMIISETLLTTTTASADSFTAHRLLGPDIMNHPRMRVIEFNPVATTFLTKALELVAKKEARHSGRRRTPGQAVLQRLGEVGDVRSAIASLEFLCLRGDIGSDWGGRVAERLRKGAKISSSMTDMERESMVAVTQREATLGIFHAVAKVVYNKREDVIPSGSTLRPPPQPPDHFPQHARLKHSQISVDELIDELGTDTQTFIAALHENYMLSCQGVSPIECVNDCIDALSDSDLLSSDRNGRLGYGNIGGGLKGGNFQGAGSDGTRQNEISFQIAVRGILFALPTPVNRHAKPSLRASTRSSKGEAFKMFYPTSSKLWRQREEIESLVIGWTNQSMTGSPLLETMSGRVMSADQKTGSIENWNRNLLPSDACHGSVSPSSETPSASLIISNKVNLTEMILERLPYIAKIKHNTLDPIHRHELEQITQFHGLGIPTDETSDNNETTPMATERVSEPTAEERWSISNSRAGQVRRSGEKGSQGLRLASPFESSNGKLLLSDDDIEDD